MAASNDPIPREPSDVDTPDRAVSLVRVMLWLLALTAGIVALHRLGATALSPPAWSPASWTDWWAVNEPVTASMALLRLIVLGVGWYLLAVTGLTLLVAWTRAAAASRLLSVIAVRPLRDMVATMLGVAMVTITSAPASASPLQVNDVHTPVAVHLVAEEVEDGGPDPPVDMSEEAAGAQEASDALRRLRERAGRFAEEGGTRGRADPAGVAPDLHGVGDADDHLVVAGESFWSIAQGRLEAVGAPTDEVAVAAYWLVLIDANRDRLVVTDEPDLILPGQRLALPEVEAALIGEEGS
jgi:hypothetical protein